MGSVWTGHSIQFAKYCGFPQLPLRRMGPCTIPHTRCSTLLKSEAQIEALARKRKLKKKKKRARRKTHFSLCSLYWVGEWGFSCRRSSSAGINFPLHCSILLTQMMLQRPLWDNTNARLQLTADFLLAVLREGVGSHQTNSTKTVFCHHPQGPAGHPDETTSPGKQGHSLEKSKCLSWQMPAHPTVLSVELQLPLTPQEALPCQRFSCCLFEAVRFNSFNRLHRKSFDFDHCGEVLLRRETETQVTTVFASPAWLWGTFNHHQLESRGLRWLHESSQPG